MINPILFLLNSSKDIIQKIARAFVKPNGIRRYSGKPLATSRAENFNNVQVPKVQIINVFIAKLL